MKKTETEAELKGSSKEKCFVIMPISDHSDYDTGHFTLIYKQIFVPAILDAGYEPYRVDQENLSQSIIQSIFDGLTQFPMAICDLSSGNPNVLYELGIRQSYDLPVILVKDNKTEFIFDVAGINTIVYRSDRLYENVLEAREKIKKAIIATKEGKEKNSLVSVIRTGKAIMRDEAVSGEDKNEYLLKGLLNKMEIMEYMIKQNWNNQIVDENNINLPNYKNIDTQITNLTNRIVNGKMDDFIFSNEEQMNIETRIMELARRIERLPEGRSSDRLRNKFVRLQEEFVKCRFVEK